MSKIQLIPLDQTTIQLIDGDRGVNYPSNKDLGLNGYCLFLDSSNLTKNGFDFSSKVFITKEKDNSMGKGKIQNGDLVMNTRGTLGNIGYYTTDIPHKNMRINSGMLIIRGGDEYDQSFLYGFFRSKLFFSQVENIMSGSVQKQLPVWIFNFIKVPKLNISSQQKIASVLSTLDSKIELNNKINAELEAMAKTLYDYWFVQFDFPDENGKPYKSSGGEMVYNENLKREIPEEWKVKKLNEIFKFEKGIEPGSVEYLDVPVNENCIKFFRVGDIEGESSVYVDSSNMKYILVEERDVIVTFDGSVGKLGFGLNGAFSGGLRKICDKSKKFDNSLVYFIFKDNRIILTIHKYSTGSILLHASSSIDHLKIPFEENIYLKYQEIVKPIFNQMVKNKQENQKLAELRDWLLPMLMNGQVTVN